MSIFGLAYIKWFKNYQNTKLFSSTLPPKLEEIMQLDFLNDK